MSALSRRDLFRLLGATAIIAKLPGCGSSGAAASGDAVFTAPQLAMLNGLADVIIPPDDEPGGSDLGVAQFIETLLNAYDGTGAPRIYAGGPFSGRNPVAGVTGDDFSTFIELDRVLDFAWRLQLTGSAGVGGAPNDALLGEVVALKQQLVTGLATAQTIADGVGGAEPDYQYVYDSLPADFQQLVFDLVTQAAWAAPEYGGNPDLAGWNMVHFEGDSLPLGYSQWNGSGYTERPESPMSTPNLSDPEPMTADIQTLLAEVVSVLGGKVAS